MDIQRQKQGFAILSCDMLPLQRKQGDFQGQVYYSVEFLPSTFKMYASPTWSDWSSLPNHLKHILSL